MLPDLLKTGLTLEGTRTPTLVLTDFSANDAFDKDCAPATEALVRYVLGSLPNVALLISKAIPSTCSYDFAATTYGVPVVSFERVINDADASRMGANADKRRGCNGRAARPTPLPHRTRSSQRCSWTPW